MLKNISRLECSVNDKIYHLTCDHDSPLEHVKEALFQFQKYVGKVEDEIKATQVAQAEKAKIEEPTVEVVENLENKFSSDKIVELPKE